MKEEDKERILFHVPVLEEVLDAVAAENTHRDDGRVPHVPFGFINDSWLKFREIAQPGDILEKFKSGRSSWICLAGREGYRLIRDGVEIAAIYTKMS
jgi:hypothetical protein